MHTTLELKKKHAIVVLRNMFAASFLITVVAESKVIVSCSGPERTAGKSQSGVEPYKRKNYKWVVRNITLTKIPPLQLKSKTLKNVLSK